MTHSATAGMFYWPTDHYSVPADNLCWHVPPSPDADYRCVRERGHPGKHRFVWSPKLTDKPHDAHAAYDLVKRQG